MAAKGRISMNYSHISEHIKNAVDEVTPSSSSTIDNEISELTNKKIQLTDGVTSDPVPLGSDNSDIVVHTEVDITKHKHTITTVKDGVIPEANTIVVRDSSGDIRSNGTSANSTGYILANGVDLSTLFIRKDNTNIEPVNIDVNSSSGQNVVTSLRLEKNGSQLRLYRSFGWVCNCNASWYCRCCC